MSFHMNSMSRHCMSPRRGSSLFHVYDLLQAVISVFSQEMQSLSGLCAQPLGLENAQDMSAGDLRSRVTKSAKRGSDGAQVAVSPWFGAQARLSRELFGAISMRRPPGDRHISP